MSLHLRRSESASTLIALLLAAPTFGQDLPRRDSGSTRLPEVIVEATRPKSSVRRAESPRRTNPVRMAPARQSAQTAQMAPSVSAGAPQPKAASEKTFSGDEILARPYSRPGETLEATPGLIVTQHSGEGKANQYFLRGYNLDHGTDLAITVDGMPINMRSHAHGQ